jgi:malonyl-CoA O-methyltransferase
VPGNGPSRRAVARAFRRAAPGYAQGDFLHAELRSRLLDRLRHMRLQPANVLDLGAGPPEATADIAARLPKARLIAIDLVPEMLGASPDPWARVCADAARLPLADASVDLVVAAMLLHWCEDAPAVLAEARRVLRYPGLLLLTTLGPDTFKELRSAWPRDDRQGRTLDFTDMHNLGDALVRAGFAEPVVDTERLTVTYRDLDSAVHDLRAVGATNLAPGRRRSLTGRERWASMASAYEKMRNAEGVLPASIEVIYGQAWAGEGRQATAGEIAVPLRKISHRGARPELKSTIARVWGIHYHAPRSREGRPAGTTTL